MENRKGNIVDLERRKTKATSCDDEPCDRLLSAEERIVSLEETVTEGLKDIRADIRRSRSHTTKSVSSITAIATLIAAILSTYQAKSGTNNQQLQDAVKQILIEQTKGH